MRPLTVLVPCKNEERHIEACLLSFRDLADEILIADSGSTDATLELAASFERVRIIHGRYTTSGEFKNWAIPQAQHEWILLVDADERVTPELAQEIRQLLREGPACRGYWIRRINHFLGHRLYWGAARRDAVIRFFHRDVSRYEGPSDHGEVRLTAGRVGRLRHCLLHYSIQTYEDYFRKFERYTTLQAEQWYRAGWRTSWAQLLVRPAWRFLREYFLDGGFLDGKVGLQVAVMAANYSFTKQARLWERWHGLQNKAALEFSDTNRMAATMERVVEPHHANLARPEDAVGPLQQNCKSDRR